MVTDDHPLMREGINTVIQGAEDIIVVADADNGQQALEMFRVHRPDVTLIDLRMPITDGIDAIKAIRREFPASRFIVLTTYQGDVQALRALKAGATQNEDALEKLLVRQWSTAPRKSRHVGGYRGKHSQLRSLFASSPATLVFLSQSLYRNIQS
jgi:YesN/AraC family two-component response regulator